MQLCSGRRNGTVPEYIVYVVIKWNVYRTHVLYTILSRNIKIQLKNQSFNKIITKFYYVIYILTYFYNKFLFKFDVSYTSLWC